MPAGLALGQPFRLVGSRLPCCKGLSCALPADYGDGRNVEIYIGCVMTCSKELGQRCGPKGTHSSKVLEHAFPSGSMILWFRSANGLVAGRTVGGGDGGHHCWVHWQLRVSSRRLLIRNALSRRDHKLSLSERKQTAAGHLITEIRPGPATKPLNPRAGVSIFMAGTAGRLQIGNTAILPRAG